MSLINQIAETRIKNALSRGELDNLPGQGKPLSLDDDLMVPEEVRMGLRVLKNAGAVPPELLQRLELNQLKQSLQSSKTVIDKRRLCVKLSLLGVGLGN